MEHTSDELDMTTWAVVGTASSTKFLGRVLVAEGETLRGVLKLALEGGALQLFPAFDFFAPIQQKGEGFQRKPLVMPLDFVLSGVPVHIRPVFAYLCDDMQEDDRNAYKGFVEQALALANDTIAQRDGEKTNGGTAH